MEPQNPTIRYHGSLVITRESIARITASLQDQFPDLSLTASAHRRRFGLHECASLSMLKTVENPKDSAILGIKIVGTGTDQELKFEIYDDDPVVEVSGIGIPTEKWQEVEALVAQEVRDTRAFYWWWTSAVSWCRRHRIQRLWFGALIVWAVWVAGVALFSGGVGNPTPSITPVVEEVPSGVAHPGASMESSLWVTLLYFGGMAGVGATIGIVALHLFPTATFKVGEGIDRYNTIVKLRFLVLTVVVIPTLSALWSSPS